MQLDDEVTEWLAAAAGGNPDAQQQLWNHCFEQLARVANQRLSPRARRISDGEDVALSAFDSFLRRAHDGRFPKLDDRHDLWKLLVTMTIRKTNQRNSAERRQKRGGGTVRGESVFGGEPGQLGLADMAKEMATPVMAAELSDQIEYLFARLNDATLTQVAMRKLEGYSHAEIAESLSCTVRTVERKLERIRNLWQRT